MTAVRQLPVHAIVAGGNDRTVFDPDALGELAASMAAHGLAQPITVRPRGGQRHSFEIVAGERRWRAAKLLGWAKVPALVSDLDDAQAAAVMLAENTQRENLDPIDEAHAFAKRMERFGLNMAEVAHMAGTTLARVVCRVPLLKLVPEAQDRIRVGELPVNYGRLMACLDNNRQRLAIAAWLKGLGLDAFRALCSRLEMEQNQEQMFDPDDFLRAEDYAEDARAAARKAGKATLARMVDRLAEICPDADLAAEARDMTRSLR